MLWPLIVYFIAVLILVTGMLVLSSLLGQRHGERTTGEPYESGMIPVGSARLRFPSRFYLVALFFVIFDLESAFIFAWAVAVREIGWSGYWALLVFTGMLIIALLYLWRSGALDWRTIRQKKQALKSTKEIR